MIRNLIFQKVIRKFGGFALLFYFGIVKMRYSIDLKR